MYLLFLRWKGKCIFFCHSTNLRNRKCVFATVYFKQVGAKARWCAPWFKRNLSCCVLSSIGQADHIHPPDIGFHNVGLWGDDIIDSRGWELQKLSTIRSRLGHKSVSVLHWTIASSCPTQHTQCHIGCESFQASKCTIIHIATPDQWPSVAGIRGEGEGRKRKDEEGKGEKR